MAGHPPKRRAAWQPPSREAGEASGPSRAGAPQRPPPSRPAAPPPGPPAPQAARPPGQPPAGRGAPEPLSEKDLAGPSTGRGFRRGADAPAVPAPSDPGEGRPSLSPFQQYAPGADQLDGAGGRTDSSQVIAIVGALGFMMAASLVVVGVVATLGLVTVGNMVSDGELIAGKPGSDEDVGHIRDTGVAPAKIIERRRGPAPRSGGGEDEDDGKAAIAAPTTAPGTIILAVDGVHFRSIEVNCPEHSIRARANFRNKRAVVQGLPTTESCRVTFQGSQPVYTRLRGGETRTCYSINPTDCR